MKNRMFRFRRMEHLRLQSIEVYYRFVHTEIDNEYDSEVKEHEEYLRQQAADIAEYVRELQNFSQESETNEFLST